MTLNATGNDAINYGPASGNRTIDGNVTINGNASGNINLQNLTIKGDLIVNTPNATVNNSATVAGTITITDVATGTWNENADNNKFVINDKTGITFNVAAGKTVQSIEVGTDAKSVVIDNKGTINTVTNNSSHTVTVDGEGSVGSVEGSVKVEAVEKAALTDHLSNAASSANNNGNPNNFMSLENVSTDGTSVTADFSKADKEKIKAIYNGLGDKIVNGNVTGADGVAKDAYDYAIDSYVMNTFARYVGALHRADEGKTVSEITFDNNAYTWEGTAKGSNWKTSETSLVAAVAKEQKSAIRVVNLTINGFSVNFKAVNVPTKEEILSN